MSESAELIAKQIPTTSQSAIVDLSAGHYRTPEIKALLDEAAQLHKQGEAKLSLKALEHALSLPGNSNLYLTDWLRLPVYLQYAGLEETAWEVLDIYRERRQDWLSQREVAYKMQGIARQANCPDRFYASVLWFNCCEDRLRTAEIEAACCALDIGFPELEEISASLTGKGGRLSKAPAGCSEGLQRLRKTLWQHHCSLDIEMLHPRLQGFCHKQGIPFPRELTERLIQYRLTTTTYSHEAVISLLQLD